MSDPLPFNRLELCGNVVSFVYAWQTARAWRGTCATFTLTLDDATVHTADFRFI